MTRILSAGGPMRRPSNGRSSDLLRLIEPDVPGDGAGEVVVDGVAGEFEGELDLAVVVALMPGQVLKEEDGVVIVDFHFAARFDFGFGDLADGFGAVVEQLGDAVGVGL